MHEVDSSKDARYQLSLGKRKLERRDQRLAELDDAGVHRAPKRRTEAEWAALSEEAKRAAHRERAYLTQVFESHPWRPSDISFALGATSYVKEVFKEREFFTEHFNRVKELVDGMEEREFGETFGLYLHYEMRLTFDKILRMVQAACKKYKHASDHYRSKPLLYNPYESDRHGHAKVVYVPRIAPPRNKLELLVRRIEAKCGVQSMENGRLAFKSFEMMLNQLLHQDPGHGDMPPLSFFAGGAAELPIVISLDATGYGTQQLNTIAMRNPYLSRSAQHLRVFGLGNCSDDRAGSTRLLGPNLGTINEAIQSEMITCRPCENGESVDIRPRVFMVFDVCQHCGTVSM